MNLCFLFPFHHLMQQQSRTVQFSQQVIPHHLKYLIQSDKCLKHNNFSHQLLTHQLTLLCKRHYNHKMDLKYKLAYYILQFHCSIHMSMTFLKHSELNSKLCKDKYKQLFVQFTAHLSSYFYSSHTLKISSLLFRFHSGSKKHLK